VAWWVLAYFGDAKRGGLLNWSREMEAVELRRWVWFGGWLSSG